MKKSFQSQILRLVVVVITLGFAATTFLSQTVARKELTGTTNTSPCTAKDKLEVTSFYYKTQPTKGKVTSFVMTIKNKCPSGTESFSVPWVIMIENTRLKSGTVTIAPEASSEVIATWTAKAGTFFFYGRVDPLRTIADSDRLNNEKSVRVSVQ